MICLASQCKQKRTDTEAGIGALLSYERSGDAKDIVSSRRACLP